MVAEDLGKAQLADASIVETQAGSSVKNKVKGELLYRRTNRRTKVMGLGFNQTAGTS